MSEAADDKRMKLRYAGACRVCGGDLPDRSEAIYERVTKTVRCVECPDAQATEQLDAVPNVGTPGASARREFNRRHTNREQKVRANHPKLGGLILKLSDDPQSTTAWQSGALGEERLGHRLNELASDTLRLLHDRRIPSSRANIDHLAVTPSGVFVIDAKKYAGRPTLKVEGGLIRKRTEKLIVGSRDRTNLVDGVLKQLAVVQTVIPTDVPVIGVLCFIEADWPVFAGAFTTRGVMVVRPKKLYPQLAADGPLVGSVIDQIHRQLASALPAA